MANEMLKDVERLEARVERLLDGLREIDAFGDELTGEKCAGIAARTLAADDAEPHTLTQGESKVNDETDHYS